MDSIRIGSWQSRLTNLLGHTVLVYLALISVWLLLGCFKSEHSRAGVSKQYSLFQRCSNFCFCKWNIIGTQPCQFTHVESLLSCTMAELSGCDSVAHKAQPLAPALQFACTCPSTTSFAVSEVGLLTFVFSGRVL